jgi:hypothetical protein
LALADIIIMQTAIDTTQVAATLKLLNHAKKGARLLTYHPLDSMTQRGQLAEWSQRWRPLWTEKVSTSWTDEFLFSVYECIGV